MKTTFVLFFIFLGTTAMAQQAALLSSLPTTEEEFKASEPNVLATIDWLEKTPITQDEVKRKEQYTFLVAWLTNSPTVTIEINSEVLPFIDNGDLLIYHMAGWAKYALQNNYSKDVLKGNLAGIRTVITIYKLGGFKKDKNILKLMYLDDKGELEQWIKDKLGK